MKNFLKVFTVCLFLTLLFSCGKKETAGKNQTIVVGLPNDPITLDPPMYSEIFTHNLNLVLYNRLYELTIDGSSIVPDLAVALPKIEEDGTKYTIEVKKGIKFHNGEDFTVDDVIYSFERGAFSEKSQMKSIYALMYDIQKIDDYTFSFRTGKLPEGSPVKNSELKSFAERSKYYKPVSFGSQVNQLTWLGSSIVDKQTMEAAEKDGTIKDYGTTWAIGTGPYKFESWALGDNVVLLRNTNYHNYNTNSNIEKIIYKTIKDPSALKTSFMTKEVDILASIDALDIAEIQKQNGQILTPNGYFGYHYLAFNMKSPLVGQVNANGSADLDGVYDLTTDSAKLREAIIMAINPADINNSVDIMNKTGKISRQFIETLPYGKVTDIKGTRLENGNDETGYYNPQKAKELFDSLPDMYKKAGSLKLTVLSGSIFVKEAIIVKDQIKKVFGVDLVTIQQVAQSEIVTRRVTSDPNVWDLYIGWTNTDDSYYIFVAFDGFNTSVVHDTKYYDKEAQKWIEAGNAYPNGEDRNKAYQMATVEILKAMPRLPLVAMKGHSAAQKNIERVLIAPSGSLRLHSVVKK